MDPDQAQKTIIKLVLWHQFLEVCLGAQVLRAARYLK